MTIKTNFLLLTVICMLSSTAMAQKIKYKDLFVLLNAKQYEQAEPFLKKYLKENQDNPNAFLFMGFMYEEKMYANDVLRESTKLGTNSDSAVLFLDKAYKTIDERELKKNEEYYEFYSRRDMRTGKFGLKLSDIQFDLEKKIKAIKERGVKAKALKEKFDVTQRIYSHSEKLYKDIASKFKDRKEFFLRSDENLVTALGLLSRKYDSCLLSFSDYKAALSGIGKTEHKQELDEREINNFKEDGYAVVDFFQDEVKVWGYKRWAASNLEVIEKEIMPLRETLVKIDGELNAIQAKIKKDSVSQSSEIKLVQNKVHQMGLKKFDTKPLPNDVFVLKIYELEYGSALSETRKLRDSASLVVKQNLYKSQIKHLNNIDSMASILYNRDWGSDEANYKSFITDAFGSVSVLKSLIKTTGDFAISEKTEKEKRIKKIEQLLPWVIDQNDSIPVTAAAQSKKYFPLTIVEENHTYGLTYQDSITFAYFYKITPSRQVSTKASVKLDSSAFKKASRLLLKGLSASDGSSKAFYTIIYSEEKVKEKNPAQILLINEATGLTWSNFYYLEGVPEQAVFSKETGALTLKLITPSGNKLFTVLNDGKVQP